AAVVAFLQWLPICRSRVLNESQLDASWRNAIPAAGDAVAAFLTLTPPAFLPERVRGDRVRLAVSVALALLALPWIAAELGFAFTYVPGLGQIFQTQEARWTPGPYVVHPAVHYGDHHGLEG